MSMLALICNIGIPILMISIGVLYKCNSYKKIDKILDLDIVSFKRIYGVF